MNVAALAPSRHEVISNDQLRNAFLDERMLNYFSRKLPDVLRSELIVRIDETLKFLFISPECSGSIPVTREIDDVWHYWILQTQEYMRLCSLLPAGEYIHHCSNDYLMSFCDPTELTDDLDNVVRMLALYVQHFGPFEPDRTQYWRFASHLIGRCGWSIDDLNEWLRSPAFTAEL